MAVTAEEILDMKLNFHEISQIPKVIGALDCTHIRIKSPGGDDAERFRNRKGYFSINVQTLADPKLKIQNIVARWSGSAHDSTIFNNSRLKALMENNYEDCFLVGDLGYPLETYLMTPLQNHITRAEHFYNNSVNRTRNVIERSYGVWKRRILDHCNIGEIHEGTFHNLGDLSVLHLDNNKLKYLPPDVFAVNNTLKKLTIMYNDISDIHPEAFRTLWHLTELDLRGNRVTEIISGIFQPLEHLTNLYLLNNRIKAIKSSNFPDMSLTLLSLAENYIEIIEAGSFSNLSELNSLFLSNNKLTKLTYGVFANLTNLASLTLNDNRINYIEKAVFQDTPNLVSLNLERNVFRTLENELFEPLTALLTIYFDRFELCSSAQHVRNCYPKGDGISDREHILANPILRTCVWVMAGIGCTGNIIVLLGRHFAPSNNIVHSLYLKNLALSDLLMGIYLLIIAAEDQYYRGVYLTYQYIWRHSNMCKLCGFLSTLSCESSVLILTLVTWDRFVSVTQPLARKQPSKKTAAASLLFLWCVAAIVALLPITHFSQDYFGNEFYGNNGVCLSLHIHEPFAMGWQYSAVMFILLNAVALIFISYAYLRMINEIRASGVACRSTRQHQDRDKVAQRFGIIVFTDCLCWVPVILVKLVALSGKSIHQDLYAWLAIFVLPINSALNPVLYTLTTTIFKKQMRKLFSSCYRKNSDHHHTASDSGFSLSLAFPIGSTKRVINYRGTHTSSLTTSKNSWRRSTAV